MPNSPLLALAGGALAGALLTFLIYRLLLARAGRTAGEILSDARKDAERQVRDAQREAEALKSAALVEGKEAALALREEAERDAERRRDDLKHSERRLEEREGALERRGQQLAEQEASLQRRRDGIREREAELENRQAEVTAIKQQQQASLERVAGLSSAEARQELLKQVENEARGEAAALAREIKEATRRTAEREAKKIVAQAVQRLASDQAAESTVSAVTLPSDEMKGRIIGREGRNIRAFETATGVDVIIDDTPDTVVVSCFNPIRREVARRSLEALIADGRIHPGRIEEIVKKVEGELEQELVELGERAAYEVGIHGLHPELIKIVGRMKYRTSYGQNILDHSKEVAWLAGIMAAELRCDVALAKRGSLLHDIGKVLTHDHEGTHVELGVDLARKYGEDEKVINCIEAHHDDVPHQTVESVLVQAADGISGARPGARREAFETYVKRLTRLEEIANGFDGVEKSSVIQAGREIRVVVKPERITDDSAVTLCDEIARKVESELQYPGQIKVVVIRETRSVDFAR